MIPEKSPDELSIVVIHNGPCEADKDKNMAEMARITEAALAEEPADFVVFCELATTPYFCVISDPKYFDWAEPIPGPTTELFRHLAEKYKVNMILPVFERGGINGTFYNSAVILDRRGDIVQGQLPDGTMVSSYRKCHISAHFDYSPTTNEKFYFRGGPGFPTFDVDGVRIGCLICYDRSFPESWRVLALQGAKVVFLISASFAERRAASFIPELQTAAMQNGLFAVAAAKAGKEVFEGLHMNFFGSSCVIDPTGEVIAQAPSGTGPAVLRATVDLSQLEVHSRMYHYMRDRRPELYSAIDNLSFVERADSEARRRGPHNAKVT